MAVDLYQPFTNPIAKETFRCLSYSDEAYVMEWIVQPEGYVPIEHIHLNQDEIFHVKQGEIRLVINGQEQFAKAGESITVPKGVAHIAFNNKPEILACVVEYKPGLDMYQGYQCFAGLTLDGEIDKKGAVNIPKMMYFMRRMRAKALFRPTNVPQPLFQVLLQLFYLVGSVVGWEKQFRKYTM